MIPVSRLAHVSLRTARLEQMVTYYTEVLGFEETGRTGDGAVRLGCGDARTALEFIPAGEPALDHIALALPLGLSADAAIAELEAVSARPLELELVPDAVAGIGLKDPDALGVQLLEVLYPPEPSSPGPRAEGRGIGPVKIGHVAIKVEDVAAVQSFYQERLGFRFSDAIGDDFVFLRCNVDHHALNFLRAEPVGGVHHIAFELQDWAQIKRACDELSAHGITLLWGPGRHGPGHNLFTYHQDPDGNIIELFAELDHMSNEGVGVYDWRPWHDGPQVPRRWEWTELASANSWGVLPPPEMGG
jgi:catechol 2,3-dioxygenase-like lactoylglutathione lyase family enzyme